MILVIPIRRRAKKVLTYGLFFPPMVEIGREALGADDTRNIPRLSGHHSGHESTNLINRLFARQTRLEKLGLHILLRELDLALRLSLLSCSPIINIVQPIYYSYVRPSGG